MLALGLYALPRRGTCQRVAAGPHRARRRRAGRGGAPASGGQPRRRGVGRHRGDAGEHRPILSDVAAVHITSPHEAATIADEGASPAPDALHRHRPPGRAPARRDPDAAGARAATHGALLLRGKEPRRGRRVHGAVQVVGLPAARARDPARQPWRTTNEGGDSLVGDARDLARSAGFRRGGVLDEFAARPRRRLGQRDDRRARARRHCHREGRRRGERHGVHRADRAARRGQGAGPAALAGTAARPPPRLRRGLRPTKPDPDAIGGSARGTWRRWAARSSGRSRPPTAW